MGLKDLWSYYTKDSSQFDWESRKQLDYAVGIVSTNRARRVINNSFRPG